MFTVWESELNGALGGRWRARKFKALGPSVLTTLALASSGSTVRNLSLMVNPYATVPMRLSRAPGLVFPNLTILWAIYWVGSTYPSGKLYFGLCQLARSTPKVSNIARAHIAPSIYSEENPNTPKQPKNIFPTFF